MVCFQLLTTVYSQVISYITGIWLLLHFHNYYFSYLSEGCQTAEPWALSPSSFSCPSWGRKLGRGWGWADKCWHWRIMEPRIKEFKMLLLCQSHSLCLSHNQEACAIVKLWSIPPAAPEKKGNREGSHFFRKTGFCGLVFWNQTPPFPASRLRESSVPCCGAVTSFHH